MHNYYHYYYFEKEKEIKKIQGWLERPFKEFNNQYSNFNDLDKIQIIPLKSTYFSSSNFLERINSKMIGKTFYQFR